MTLHLATTLVSGACLIAAAGGWFTAQRRRRPARQELAVLAGSVAAGFAVQRDWLRALAIATLFYGVYHAFRAWRSDRAQDKLSFHFAFFGVAWFLLLTTRDYRVVSAAAALGLYGPAAACWATVRTRRSIGLLILIAALLFQLSRAVLLLEG